MLIFDPPLAAQRTVYLDPSVPSVLHFILHSPVISLASDEAAVSYELWSTLGSTGWHATPFVEFPSERTMGAASSETARLWLATVHLDSSTLSSATRSGYTYRVRHLGGAIKWLGDQDEDGAIFLCAGESHRSRGGEQKGRERLALGAELLRGLKKLGGERRMDHFARALHGLKIPAPPATNGRGRKQEVGTGKAVRIYATLGSGGGGSIVLWNRLDLATDDLVTLNDVHHALDPLYLSTDIRIAIWNGRTVELVTHAELDSASDELSARPLARALLKGGEYAVLKTVVVHELSSNSGGALAVACLGLASSSTLFEITNISTVTSSSGVAPSPSQPTILPAPNPIPRIPRVVLLFLTFYAALFLPSASRIKFRVPLDELYSVACDLGRSPLAFLVHEMGLFLRLVLSFIFGWSSAGGVTTTVAVEKDTVEDSVSSAGVEGLAPNILRLTLNPTLISSESSLQFFFPTPQQRLAHPSSLSIWIDESEISDEGLRSFELKGGMMLEVQMHEGVKEVEIRC